MIEPRFERDARASSTSHTQLGPSNASAKGLSIPEQYERLLGKLAAAERELQAGDASGRSTSLEEASAIVFDLLYHLDFKHGGELVPRLAGLYGYVANELLNVGRTRDVSKMRHVRDMIVSLKRSWEDESHIVGKKLPFKNENTSPILDGGGK